MASLKVAFFVEEFPCVSQTFITNQMTGLLERGHELDIFATLRGTAEDAHPAYAEHDLLDRVCYYHDCAANYLLRAISAFRRALKSSCDGQAGLVLRSLDVTTYGRLAASIRLLHMATALNGRSYDIVHCQFGTLGERILPLLDVGAIKGRLVTSFRGYDATRYPRLFPGAYEELFARGDMFLPVSRSLQRKLEEVGADAGKITVLHSGVDCAKLPFSERQPPQQGPVRILAVGRLTEKKGFSFAIRAVGKLLEQDRKVTLAIVGDGEMREELQALTATLGVQDQVRFLGSQPHDEVRSLLDTSHLLVAPSVTAADGDQEGIPNILKEAMACGLPVVATDHSGIPELVEDGKSGFLVPERDVDSLAERLTTLLDNPARWASFGRRGRQKVEEEFDIGVLNDQLIEIYERVLAGCWT